MSLEHDSFSPAGNRVLVTGGAGFIGSSLATALVSDNDVRVLDDLSSGLRSNVPDGATLIEGDIRNDDDVARAMEDVDVLYHQAALIDVERSMERPELTHEINVDGTVKLLEYAREEGAHVVFASSAAVYGHPETSPVSEAAATDPTSPYGLSKLVGEKYVEMYDDLYDLSAVVLRYFNVYGSGQIGGDYGAVISTFVEQASNADPITVEGDGSQTRDFVHIDDIVRANLLAANPELSGTFNVGTGNSVSIRELAETVRDVLGSESEIVHTPARTGDIDHSLADISKLESRLGYEPVVSLSSGLERLTETRLKDPVSEGQ